ncbi:HAD-IIIA family hydrolase [Actinomadura macrotermitis]|uniref:D,D-heptose 1,7-bisphosphate phosphatase n=1 Tax=Actinomadura macrotermitis TaxID=2585200 RepID=A0A7K0BZ03_9ACTN|nr:Phosphoglycolate phosphatase [Actinomadura macrotermitis]
MSAPPTYSVVVPTIGRPSLRIMLDALLESIGKAAGPGPAEILLVDDRPRPGAPLPLPDGAGDTVRVLRSGGRGPAAARNTGWRAASGEWVVFLDDDVVPSPEWAADLAADLTFLPATAAGTQGRVRVPPPLGRRPTDWERNTAGLEAAAWITADMAYRRQALEAAGGFDERFRRAFREDADLALRVSALGHRLVQGTRRITHPVRPAGFWVSVRMQAGNADDALMKRVHGPDWRVRAHEHHGRFGRHAVTTAAALLTLAAYPARRRPAGRAVLLGSAAVWTALTAEFAAARIRPGPRTFDEVARMLVTSVVIPPVAVRHRIRGTLAHRRAEPWGPRPVVLFDRDDTLIRDVPYNGDPAKVEPMPGARRALDRLRARGIRVGVISNQSGVAKGCITDDDVRRVNARVEELLGPFEVWEFCPHDAADGCGCRKPAPGLIERAAVRLGVHPRDCVVIGDIGGDVEAAAAAGARGILVPTRRTLRAEVRSAREVAPDLETAVELVLAAPARRDGRGRGAAR